jgi:hypothetical protein
MAKITVVGAGGYVFPFRLIGDLLSYPALRDSTLALMDIDADRLERTAGAARPRRAPRLPDHGGEHHPPAHERAAHPRPDHGDGRRAVPRPQGVPAAGAAGA